MGNWGENAPDEEGWYWVRYKGKSNRQVLCPAILNNLSKGVKHLQTARNDTFIYDPKINTKGFQYAGAVDNSLRFYSEKIIPPPRITHTHGVTDGRRRKGN